MSPLVKLRKVFHSLSLRFTTPLRIEFDVTDACNLNCKGCTHYSPVAPREFEALGQLDNSMRVLSSAKGHDSIKEIYLIGGETLLYPSLKEAMRMARRYFSWCRISIFTNGLLLPKMDGEFWNLCRSLDIRIALTRYPVKFDYDDAEALCRRNGVACDVFGDRRERGSFFRFGLDPSKRQNRWLSHLRCYSFGCMTVKEDRLYPCSISACAGHLNSRFGSNFSWQPGDFITLSDKKPLSVSTILRLRNLPVPFCSYCKKAGITPYEISKRVKNEWIDEPD